MVIYIVLMIITLIIIVAALFNMQRFVVSVLDIHIGIIILALISTTLLSSASNSKFEDTLSNYPEDIVLSMCNDELVTYDDIELVVKYNTTINKYKKTREMPIFGDLFIGHWVNLLEPVDDAIIEKAILKIKESDEDEFGN